MLTHKLYDHGHRIWIISWKKMQEKEFEYKFL
jgi:hypothetical protein